jgi:hypothetical protein
MNSAARVTIQETAKSAAHSSLEQPDADDFQHEVVEAAKDLQRSTKPA